MAVVFALSSSCLLLHDVIIGPSCLIAVLVNHIPKNMQKALLASFSGMLVSLLDGRSPILARYNKAIVSHFQVNNLGLAGLAGMAGGGTGALAVASRAAAWGTSASQALSRQPPSEPACPCPTAEILSAHPNLTVYGGIIRSA